MTKSEDNRVIFKWLKENNCQKCHQKSASNKVNAF